MFNHKKILEELKETNKILREIASHIAEHKLPSNNKPKDKKSRAKNSTVKKGTVPKSVVDKIKKEHGTAKAQMESLHALGYDHTDIARALGKRNQHVWNVLGPKKK